MSDLCRKCDLSLEGLKQWTSLWCQQTAWIGALNVKSHENSNDAARRGAHIKSQGAGFDHRTKMNQEKMWYIRSLTEVWLVAVDTLCRAATETTGPRVVTSSDALVTNSFLLLPVRHLLLVAMHLLLIAC